MGGSISRQDFIRLLENRVVEHESDIRDLVLPKLKSFFRVVDEQIEEEVITTAFSHNGGTTIEHPKGSERADIVIWSQNNNEKVKRALIVIELKLDFSVRHYDARSYVQHENKLHKYCQDLGAPYSVLISDRLCKFFRYKLDSSPEEIDAIPYPSAIEGQVTRRLMRSFLFRDQSVKYLMAWAAAAIILYLFTAGVLSSFLN